MDELKAKRIFRVSQRAASANSRFIDKITGDEVYKILVKYDYKCFYCNERIKASKWQLDHFYPRANKGKNVFSNLVPCCKWCNTMKNALDGNLFINKCNQVVEFNFFKRNNITEGIVTYQSSHVYKKRIKRITHLIEDLQEDKLTDVLKYIHNLCVLNDLSELEQKPK